MQTAFYHDVAGWADYTVLGHLYLAFEVKYPHLPRLFELDKESFLNGRRKYRNALNTYAACVKSGHWPGPADAIETISLPEWAMEYTE
jgi:hypothetical protein